MARYTPREYPPSIIDWVQMDYGEGVTLALLDEAPPEYNTTPHYEVCIYEGGYDEK